MDNAIMVDIETLGNKPKSVVFEVGVVIFNDRHILDKRLFKLNSAAAIGAGFIVVESTMKWWEKQDRDIKQDVLYKGDLKTDLIDFTDFCFKHSTDQTKWWSQGHFDFPLIEDYLNYFNLPIPWKYWNIRELRTALEVLGFDYHNANKPHNAAEDAALQAQRLIKALKNN